MQIATAGGCFAQHVGRHLRGLGCIILDEEPAPPGLSAEEAQLFGFRLYSARHGNIYTVRQLLQLTREALGTFTPGDAIWRRDGRWFDALRPTVEPEGPGSQEAVRAHRALHLRAFRRALETADRLVFTMGLVEAWIHGPTGTAYPTASGVVATSDAPQDIVLHSFGFPETYSDFCEFRDLARALNPGLRFLLTVSPVPLAATATRDHLLVATMQAKSILRAVAGQLPADFADTDYFPFDEIVAGHPSRGRFYAADLRAVTSEGVACVMRHFSAAVQAGAGEPFSAPPSLNELEVNTEDAAEAVVCEEALLEAFGREVSDAE